MAPCSAAVHAPSDWRIGIHVVVDRLGQADDGEVVVVLLQERGQIRGGGVGVVAADGVQNGDAVFGQLLGCDLQRVLALFDQAALDAILAVGELDAAVADRAAAVLVQHVGAGAHLGRDRHARAEQQALVAAQVTDDFDLRSELRVTLDQSADGGRKTRRKAASSQDRNFLFLLAHRGNSSRRTGAQLRDPARNANKNQPLPPKRQRRVA